MPTEKFVDYLPGQIPVILGAAVVTNPAPGTSESWTVIVPAGIAIPAIGASVGELRAIVESEIVLVTAGTTTVGTQTWTVIRGQEGTTPVTHTNSTPLLLDLTAGSAANMEQLNPSTAQTGASSITGQSSALGFTAIGTTGAPNSARYFSATTGGAPTTGAWLQSDVVVDPTGKIWVCTSSGSPGAWVQIGTGGSGILSNEADAATYADFATAISTIGATPTALIVHTSMAVAANVTVPSTCSLVFRGTGKLAIATGVTVTINGPFSAPETAQIFSLTGTGAVQFGKNALPRVWVEWFGAKGDSDTNVGTGTDSTLGIQAAINSTPQYGGVDVCLGGGVYRVTSTLSISSANAFNNKINTRFLGSAAAAGGQAINNARSTLVWDSASTTTPLLALHSRDCIVQGIAFRNTSTRTLSVAIDIDYDGSSGFDCTQDRVIDCSFTFVTGTGGAFTDGIHVGFTATGNCEDMEFRDCIFYGLQGTGLTTSGAHGAEPFRIQVAFCNFVLGVNGVSGGDFGFYGCFFEQMSGICINVATQHGVICEQVDLELCPQFIHANSTPLTIIGGRLATGTGAQAPLTTAGNEFISCSSLTMIGVAFDYYEPLVRVAVTSATCINCYLPSNAFFAVGVSPYTTLMLQNQYRLSGNGLGAVTQADGFSIVQGSTVGAAKSFTFANGILDLIPVAYAGGNEQKDVQGLAAASGTARLWVEAASNLLLLSENGSSFRHLLAGVMVPPRAVTGTTVTTGGTFAAGLIPFYKVTFATAVGQTLPSARCQLSGTTGTTSSCALANIPLGPPGTVSRKIYRSTDLESTYGLVGTIADNTTTTFTDTGVAQGTAIPTSDTSSIATGNLGGIGAVPVATATTVGATGTATALPANPVGYIDIAIGGALYKLPYYNS